MTARTRRLKPATPKPPPRQTLGQALRALTRTMPSNASAAKLRRSVATLQKQAGRADEEFEAALRELFANLERIAMSDAPRATVRRAIRQTFQSVRDLMRSRESALFVIGRVVGKAQR